MFIIGAICVLSGALVGVVFTLFIKSWLRGTNNSSYQHSRYGPFVILYHYTTKTGAEGILRSGRVVPTRGGVDTGDATFGDGVYLTSLSPRHHRMVRVAENNYDGVWHVNCGKTQAAIEFRIPESHVERVKTSKTNGRDVWLYTKGDLHLDTYSTHQLFSGKADGNYQYTQWSK